MEKNDRISIHISTRDRWSELALLIQSLRTQTYKLWDLIILDDASGNNLMNSYLLTYLFNRIKLENHSLRLIRRDISFGVCNARQTLINSDDFNNKYVCRLDDDVILESDYLDKLLEVINKGYDIASGITPVLFQPEIIRENKTIQPIINRIDLDKEGNLINYKDDCGYSYVNEEILPADNFRSCALFKSELFEKVKYQENLTPVGFREEAFLSIRAIMNGYIIGIHTGAKAYHLLCPSGGCRYPNYTSMVQSDHESFVKWLKNNFKFSGDFMEKYHNKVLKKNDDLLSNM